MIPDMHAMCSSTYRSVSTRLGVEIITKRSLDPEVQFTLKIGA
jgi:hypothetical protein